MEELEFSDHGSEVSSASEDDFTTYSMSREITIRFEAGVTYHKSYSTNSMPMDTVVHSESDCDAACNCEVITQFAEDAVDDEFAVQKPAYMDHRCAESREPYRDSRDVGDNLFNGVECGRDDEGEQPGGSDGSGGGAGGGGDRGDRGGRGDDSGHNDGGGDGGDDDGGGRSEWGRRMGGGLRGCPQRGGIIRCIPCIRTSTH